MPEMAHEFSLIIHNYISLKIKELQAKKNRAENNDAEQFCNGQLEELFYFRKYLTDKIDLNTHKYYN